MFVGKVSRLRDASGVLEESTGQLDPVFTVHFLFYIKAKELSICRLTLEMKRLRPN